MRYRVIGAAVVVAAAVVNVEAGLYTEDFTDGVADNATLFGNAAVLDQSVRLTANQGAQLGAMAIDDLDGGQAIGSFTASFGLFIGGLTSPGGEPIFPGDGSSFHFGTLPDAAFGENGPGVGLTLSFDMFENPGGDVAPAFTLMLDGVALANNATSPFTNGQFIPVTMTYEADGTVDVTFDGNPIFTNVATGFTPSAGDRFGFGARTASASNEHRFDSIVIETTVPGGGGGVIPEPGTLALFSLAGLALARRRIRRGC